MSQGTIPGGVTNFLMAQVTRRTIPGVLKVVLGDVEVVEVDEDTEGELCSSSTILTFLSLSQQSLAKWPVLLHT